VSTEIPLYSPDGRLIGWAPCAWVEAHAGHFRRVYSRRGHLRRAYLKEHDDTLTAWLQATGRRSSYGAAFMQHLPHGRVVWALRGVRGSGR